MKLQIQQIVIFLISFFLVSCSSEEMPAQVASPTTPMTTTPSTSTPIARKSINYLALGDSYTIGQSVCETCKFPEQLKTSLSNIYPKTNFSLKVIATSGWSTTSLLNALSNQSLKPDYDLVTLLIGVNNQYQNIDFSVYKKEFPELLNKAITLAKGDNKNVIVLSIPDYAYTPYTKNYDDSGLAKISKEIDEYNSYAANYCSTKKVEFISITDITRDGLRNPNLVAVDGLHPSETAYSLFVQRMINSVKTVLQD